MSLIDREPSQGGGVVRFPGRWQCDTLFSRRDAGQKTGMAGAQPWNPLNRQSPLSRFDPISVSNRRLLRYRYLVLACFLMPSYWSAAVLCDTIQYWERRRAADEMGTEFLLPQWCTVLNGV